MFRDSGGSGELASYAMRNDTFIGRKRLRNVVSRVAVRYTVASLMAIYQSTANWLSLVVMGKYFVHFLRAELISYTTSLTMSCTQREDTQYWCQQLPFTLSL